MCPLTRSCFLLLLLGRPFACPPSPPSNLPSFMVESTLSSPCSRSDFPLTCQGAALAHLDSLPPYDLVLSTDSSVPFPFGKGGSGVLANYSLCGTEATLSFSARPVCSSFSAEACAILQGLCWSRQHQVCHFSSVVLLSDSRCPLLHLSFYLKLFGRSGRNCLLCRHVLSDYNGSSDIRFFRGTMRLMSWQNGEGYSSPLESLVVSLVSTLAFFSDWRSAISSKFFDTGSLDFHREICAPSSRSLCSLSS